VTTRGARTTEILVDPVASLPVQINVVHDGALVSHTSFEYADAGTGRLVRTRVRAEHMVSPASDARVTTEIDISNLQVNAGGGK